MKKWSLLLVVTLLLTKDCWCQNDSGLHFTPNNPKIDQYIIINGIMSNDHWYYSKSQFSLLDSVAKFININSNLVFQLESHTDCRASAEYNRDLSQRRADTARKKILPLLTDTSQLPKAVGIGEDNLFIKKCNCELSDYERKCTEAEHQQNRRTVLRIIAIKEN